MARNTVQARVTSELKKNAEAVFKSLGLNTSEAIRMFLRKTVAAGCLPFDPQKKESNPKPPAKKKKKKSDAVLPIMDTNHLLSDTDDEIDEFFFGK